MSAIWNCCCCVKTVGAFANDTQTPDTGPSGTCSGDPIAPYTRTEYGPYCGGTSGCHGPWPPRAVNTFTTAEVSTIDLNICDYGYKNVVGKKFWQGRYGFTDDYIASPTIGNKYLKYNVTASFSEDYSGKSTCFDPYSGDFSGSWQYSGGNSGNANSLHSPTIGGVEDCSGSAFVGDGNVESTNTDPDGTPHNYNCFVGPFNYCSPNGAQQYFEVVNDDCNCTTTECKQDGRARNLVKIKSLCSINGDRGILTITVPFLGTYIGPASGFGAWLAQYNTDTDEDGPCYGGAFYAINNVVTKYQVTLSDFSFSNTEIKGTVNIKVHNEINVWKATLSIGGCTKDLIYYKNATDYNGSFSFDAKLDGKYTFGDAQQKAKDLLSYWDLTDDVVYPWQVAGDCRVSPMVSLWEKPFAPSSGYCDTPADPADTAIYDGTIKGAPMDYYGKAKGYYNKGWFDFSMDAYNYSQGEGESCDSLLCYTWGFYVTDYTGVSMATQLVTGAADTSECGLGWSPFSRYLNRWYLPERPPFVDVSCAYVADGGDAVYAAKWAEKKVPLPSQSFFGPCGVRPVVGDVMRETVLKDTVTCAPTGTLRFPTALGICGKLAVVSATQSGSDVNITITGVAYLKNNDLVDFTGVAGLGAGCVVSGLTGSVTAVSSFTVGGTLSGSYTGGGYVSGGAQSGITRPSPIWYDTAPKGDYVRVTGIGYQSDNGTITAEAGNVVPTSKRTGIMAIVPPGSPEINNPKWPGATTRIYSDYPNIVPTQHWWSSIQQAMPDRYFTTQDAKTQDGVTELCTNIIPQPATPYVEARLTAPVGAPFDFSGGNGVAYNKLPAADEYGFRCSGAWTFTSQFSNRPYDTWPGSMIGSGVLSSQPVSEANSSDDITNLGPA